MVSASRRVNQHSWPGYACKAELAAALCLESRPFRGRTLLKTRIRGQFMVVASAKLWL
jgi:hypothetical protein